MWLEQGMLGEVVSQQSIDSKTVGEVTPVAVSGIAQFCSPSFPSRVILSEPQYPESQLPCWCRGLTEGLSWWHVTLARMDICAWTIGTALLHKSDMNSTPSTLLVLWSREEAEEEPHSPF